MAKFTQVNQVEITPEQFLSLCTQAELCNIYELITGPQFKHQISKCLECEKEAPVFNPNQLTIQDALVISASK